MLPSLKGDSSGVCGIKSCDRSLICNASICSLTRECHPGGNNRHTIRIGCWGRQRKPRSTKKQRCSMAEFLCVPTLHSMLQQLMGLSHEPMSRSETPIVFGFKIPKLRHKTFQKLWCTVVSRFGIFSDFQKVDLLEHIIFSYLVFLKYFGDEYGVYGSTKSENLRSSKNHLKSIAIGPGTLISHFGIIKAPSIPLKYLKKLRTTNKSLTFVCRIFMANCGAKRSKKNHKGIFGGAWTEQRVLDAENRA